MSSTWRAEQEIQAALRRAGVISERQRQAQEAALKREQDIMQREKDAEDKARRDAEAIALAEDKRLTEENVAQEKARREAEAAAAILKAKLQEEKDAKEIKRKKKEGWTDTELRLLQRLKLLARSLEDPTSVTDAALEKTARSLFQQKLTIDTAIENRREIYRAFSWGAASGNTVLIRLLALDANFKSKFLYYTEGLGLTPFQLAAQNGHLEVISLMLEVIPEAKDPNSNHRALNLAITNGHHNVAKMLLKDGQILINFDIPDEEGFTPLHHAVQKGWLELVTLITPATENKYHVNGIKGDPNNRVLHLAAESGNWRILFYLLSMDPDPNIKDSNGSTPLFKAVENGHFEAVKLLLKKEKVDINIANNFGNTPLFAAFARCQLHVAQYLLDREDLDVNATNSQGWTALMLAASFGCTLSVSRLLQYAQINVEYSVETTELLWGSLPVTKKWSALDICHAKGFRYVEQILCSFSRNDPRTYGESFYVRGRESQKNFERDRNRGRHYPSRADDTATSMETAWSDWAWNNECSCLYRYRSDATGEWRYEYDSYTARMNDSTPRNTEDFTAKASYLTSPTASVEETKAPSEPAEPTYPTPWGEWKWDRTWTNNNEKRSREIGNLDFEFEWRDRVPRDICPCTVRGICPNSSCTIPERNSSAHEEHRENYIESYTTTETYTSSTTNTVSKSNESGFSNTQGLTQGSHDLKGDKNTKVGESRPRSLFPALNGVSSSQVNSLVMESTNDAVPRVRGESGIGQIQRQSFLRTDTSESIASTLSQSAIHIAKASLSDSVNWGIAIPATVTGIVTVGLAGYALKLQRNGIESQEQQLSATKTMAATLQQIKDRLNTLSAVIEAERDLNDRDETDNSDDEVDDPPLSVPRLSEDNARIFQFIISIIKNSLIPSGSSVESHPQDDDSQSRYTSEEHVEDATNPTKSLNLLPLEGQPRSYSATTAEENSQGQNSITACPLLNELQDRFLQLKSRKPIARGPQNITSIRVWPTGDELQERYLQLQSRKPIARKLQNISSEPLLPQKDSGNNPTTFILSDLELSPEDDHLFNNLHEEVGTPEWLE